MPTRVKICGITRAEDVQLAIEFGASALGFNFYAPSPRYITAEAAREIIRAVPPLVMAVGIFADETSTEAVLKVARAAGVSAIQLHGLGIGNGLDWPLPLIRAISVDENFVPEQLQGNRDSAILLDASHPTLKGGTGRTIDWAKAREATRYARVILAGGLTPENVCEAVRQVRPFAVDVASGVESSPGIKDAVKLRTFFDAVWEADKGNADD